ncbi:MAG: LLM class F420-dependent oxidoreductase [Acidimicrobiales bacterium]
MKLGAAIGGRGDPARLAATARDLEAAGVDYLWAGEAYTGDAVSTMGFLAAVTQRAQIGSSILPIYTRTPTLLAMTAVGIDTLSSGRCVLGLGASGPQVVEGFHGVPYDAPLQRTREIIEICRSVWRRERLVHRGEKYHVPLPDGEGTGLGRALKIIDHPVRDRIPIFVASLGPKNVALSAEVADGWIPLHYWPERAAAVWGDALADGASRRPADLGSLEVVAGGPLAIGDGLDDVRDMARPALTMYFGGMGARGHNFYNDLLRRYGYEAEAEHIQDAYLGGRRKEAAAAVPQALIDGTSLVGPAGWVKERIAAYREAGVTILNVTLAGRHGLTDLELVRSWLD